MIYLDTEQVLRIHGRLILRSGGSPGILDRGKIDSAVAQPRMSFAGVELYSTLPEKAAALGYSLANNHGFVDGNKRIAHAAMEAFLNYNGYTIDAGVDEQEIVFLKLAASEMTREDFSRWVGRVVVPDDAGDLPTNEE